MADWKTLTDWEDNNKAVAIMVVDVDDVKEYWTEICGEPDKLIGLTDELIYEGLQHVSRKIDLGEYYQEIYTWATDKAEEYRLTEGSSEMEIMEDNSDGLL